MLRALVIIVLALSLAAITGCEKNPGEEYGKAMVRPIDKAERAADSANLAALKQAVQAYRATNGKNPESLEDVAGNMDLSHFDYDPATGVVSIKK